MDRMTALKNIRAKLASDRSSIGSWMQMPNASVAEIMGSAGFDWVAVDLEHGAFASHQLPDLFRALELGGTLPLARLEQGGSAECKRVLDAGAGGVIVPMIRSAAQLAEVANACRWPPAGTRGVGFSRANLFGARFDSYRDEAQAPLLVAMIEHADAVDDLEPILAVPGLDAILIGPYDLSASMGLLAQFDAPEFTAVMARCLNIAKASGIAAGLHVVAPSPPDLAARIAEGYRFLAYSIDAVLLRSGLNAVASHLSRQGIEK